MIQEEFKGKSKEWLMGYLAACYNFGIWNNGEMILGVKTKYSDIRKEINKAIEKVERIEEKVKEK